ncbi:recombinase family protein [Streptomyces sp. 3214.6]|uniref:recombinase family protein n=1 Tax=Streptomyces sp. 3214.6 TaxID=1882757 RepID=UPI00090A13C4|nr:recombinase family protein [Streptomyces sp. 3214.6]SHI65051.1 Site-specific DNA recombinase [Streptomyces sp. 3214.6]
MNVRIPQHPCLYTRLSYAPDGSLEKVERQEEDGRATGSRLRWPPFCCVYVDNGISAWQRNRKRPDWDRMLLTLDRDSNKLVAADPKANHHHDGIMVYHGDRLIRQPYDLELLLNIVDTRHIPLASVSGVRDLSNSDDRFILRIEAAQACRASDDTSRRVSRGIQAAMTGKGGTMPARSRPGGRRAFGWGLPTGATRIKTNRRTGEQTEVPVLEYDKTVPAETKLLADVSEKLLAGLSKSGGVRWLNERCRTSEGNLWSLTSMTRALTAWRMAGLVEYDGTLYKAAWDEVIPLETLMDLRALFAESAAEHGYHGYARKYLLTGNGVCSTCHDVTKAPAASERCSTSFRLCKSPHVTLSTKPVNGNRLYYCRSCGKGRNLAYFDAYVEGRTLRLLSDPHLKAELHAVGGQQNTGVRKEIAALEKRRNDLQQKVKDAADHPDVDPMLAMQAIASYDRKLETLRAQLSTDRAHRRLERVLGIAPEAWTAEPVDVRAAVVAMLWHVVMLPARQGRGFDTSSVRLWRRSLTG